MQRTVVLSVKDVPAAIATLKRTKTAVTGVRTSNVQAAYLEQSQLSINAPQRRLIQSNATRYVLMQWLFDRLFFRPVA